jgi:hypothetical protein
MLHGLESVRPPPVQPGPASIEAYSQTKTEVVPAVAQEVLAEGLHQQVHQWNAHLSVNGDYFFKSLSICTKQSPNWFHLNMTHTFNDTTVLLPTT